MTVSAQICLDASPCGPRATGVGRYVQGLATAFVEGGGSPTLIANRSPAAHEGWPAGPRVDVVRVRPTIAWLQLVAPVRARALECTLFHATTGRAPLSINMPVVLTVHDVTALTHPAWYPWRDRVLVLPWLRASLRVASAIIAVSRSTAADLKAAVGETAVPVHVIGHGVDPAFHDTVDPDRSARARSRYAGGSPFWLVLGGLTPRKNPLTVVRAYAQAVGSLGESAPLLVLAGPGGPLEKEIARLAAGLGVGGMVRLVGWIPSSDIAALMAAADAVLSPSLHEGFGLTIAEALAVGTPVVVSRRGALPEVAGDAGLIVEPEVSAFAESLVRLARNPELTARLSSEARRRGPSFRWERAAAATAGVYRSVARPPLTAGAP